jgi:bis(5'-nucleosyl)-tetraphosphatase (symmetrical)
MARYAIGDIQGCYAELRALLHKLNFSDTRDQLWLVGDLVNRGPQSLEVLRLVKDLGAAACTVLGNHDLHLLALHYTADRKIRSGDTLDAVLQAADRESLLEWLLQRPLLHVDQNQQNLLIHAGLLPSWTIQEAVELATEIQDVLRERPRELLNGMYGNSPECWDRALSGIERWRFGINVMTRMRACTAQGCLDLKIKGAPESILLPLRPWFAHPRVGQQTIRIVCGHWSALGFYKQPGILALDSGCVWGEVLTAVNLDDPDATPITVQRVTRTV